MKQIASFTIDHMKLLRGVYVSRKDKIGDEVITTFDIRLTRPNFDPVMQTGEVHTIEHLAATYLRNHPKYAEKVVYFGPMGCRTGFYLVLGGDYESKDILSLMIETFEFIRDFSGDIPGATPENCGNYSDMNLELAKYYAKSFLEDILYKVTDEHLIYPN
jgi:S-ribosylhomocysteine lyase